MSECIDDMEAYTKLTDDVLHHILLCKDPELDKSKEILNRIETRKLYKCVGQSTPIKKVDDIPNNREDLAKDILKMLGEDEKDQLKPEDIVVNHVYFNYGMKEKNPIDSVRFYTKANMDEAVKLDKNQVSLLLPESFSENVIFVYSKSDDPEKLKILRSCFSKWCLKNGTENVLKMEQKADAN